MWEKCLELLSPGVPAREDSGVWLDGNGEFLLAYVGSHIIPRTTTRKNDNIPVEYSY